jgi:hypothetical protein
MYHLVRHGKVTAVAIVRATQGCISAKRSVANHDPQQTHPQNWRFSDMRNLILLEGESLMESKRSLKFDRPATSCQA